MKKILPPGFENSLCMKLIREILRFTQDDKHFVDLSYAGDDSKRQNISRMFLVRYT
ncbi:MAG TPA: hypothetical protein PK816_03610 [Candidatus Cloacimonadota bacterium]|nr:hypothetical protein [Candidatus Cloacimonadota bacterium]